LLWRSPDPDSAEVDELESRLHVHLMGRPDAQEGPTAFMQRRDPSWTGQVSVEFPAWLDDR
jgi:hypothetical protein